MKGKNNNIENKLVGRIGIILFFLTHICQKGKVSQRTLHTFANHTSQPTNQNLQKSTISLAHKLIYMNEFCTFHHELLEKNTNFLSRKFNGKDCFSIRQMAEKTKNSLLKLRKPTHIAQLCKSYETNDIQLLTLKLTYKAIEY